MYMKKQAWLRSRTTKQTLGGRWCPHNWLTHLSVGLVKYHRHYVWALFNGVFNGFCTCSPLRHHFGHFALGLA